jgi:hypothetical protein
VHALSTHQCAMFPLRHFTLYCGWFGTEKWSSASSFSKPFNRVASVPFRCPLLQGNSVGGWRQALPLGLSEPWLPVGHPLSVVHPISSPTIPTCAPSRVRHLTTAAPLVHCLVVWYPTVLGHCLFRQAPKTTSGKKHAQCHLHSR